MTVTDTGLYDVETGLPGRGLLVDRLTMALRGAERTGHEVALVLVDLASIETADGSPAPDADVLTVVKEVADRLSATVRGIDSVGRYGPRTFALVFPGEVGEDGFTTLARRLLVELSPPVAIALRPHFVTARIGGTIARAGLDDPGAMLDRAADALREAQLPGDRLVVLRTP
ncbi:GGDEF domain-containing protein [Nocardioides nitrophenolicus]|uniref:GGDEF domain-containing protein n=1 Tax=Nocardioides nitrophenolicus TaxID=60489 RepID=UPI0019586050|nr:GGDEF domain-containing protein [Nocardioides nitrophenolicus]MBM7517703.1 diguanylate cyclase (GGDEF)-like protein [Nocardioides nitrophenolicus]